MAQVYYPAAEESTSARAIDHQEFTTEKSKKINHGGYTCLWQVRSTTEKREEK
jgi:hypothetical protein